MMKQGSFINKKFYFLLMCNIFSWGAFCINIMVDSIVGGNQLGEVALQAVTIVAPVMSVLQFVSYIIAPGTSILYGQYNGAFKKEYAYKIAGQGVIISVAISIVIAALLMVIKVPFLTYYGCTGELYELASHYYNWVIIRSLVLPLNVVIYYLILADGDAAVLLLATILSIPTNVVLSYVLCKEIGVDGLGLATVLGDVVSILASSLHFFKKINSVKLLWHFKFSDLKDMLVLSAYTSLNQIFIAIVDIVMNKIVIDTCGTSFISAYSVINLILYLFMIPGASFDACCGITTSFYGEKNNYGIKNILRTALKAVAAISFVVMCAIFIGAYQITKIYGLTSPEIIEASIRAARILALSAVPFGIAYFFFNIYSCLNKPGLSVIMAFLYNLFCPLLASVPLAYLLGFDGVSIGMSVSSFLVIIFTTIFFRWKYGKEDFPLYLENTGEEIIGFDLYVTEETIVEIRDKVKTELDKHGYEIENLELLVEELYTRIKEKNPGKKVMSECVLLFGENHVRIIVRDNGMVFNFVDENNAVESMNAHVLNSLLEQTKEKNYILTTSFNRNGFIFYKE